MLFLRYKIVIDIYRAEKNTTILRLEDMKQVTFILSLVLFLVVIRQSERFSVCLSYFRHSLLNDDSVDD